MLRFDVPQVWSNGIRWEAFVTFLLCCVALTVTPWVLVLPMGKGAVRGVLGHHRCPSPLLWKRLFTKAGILGMKEDAGPKMFAAKILFFASSVSMALYSIGSPLWKVPCIALIVFSTLEWAVSFCAACRVYGAWYRRFPPA